MKFTLVRVTAPLENEHFLRTASRRLMILFSVYLAFVLSSVIVGITIKGLVILGPLVIARSEWIPVVDIPEWGGLFYSVGWQLLLALILIRGVKNRMLSAYPIFYVYLGWVLMNSVVQWVVALSLGTNAPLYRDVYYLPTYFAPLLHIWILGDIYRRIIGYGKTSWRKNFNFVLMVVLLTAPVAWGVFSLEGRSLFYSYHTLTLFLQVAICLQICREAVRAQGKIDLGQNLKGILSGLSLMISCQAINFISFVFAQSSSQIFWFLTHFISFVASIVLMYALWDYAPPYRRELGEQSHGVLKSILPQIWHNPIRW